MQDVQNCQSKCVAQQQWKGGGSALNIVWALGSNAREGIGGISLAGIGRVREGFCCGEGCTPPLMIV